MKSCTEIEYKKDILNIVYQKNIILAAALSKFSSLPMKHIKKACPKYKGIIKLSRDEVNIEIEKVAEIIDSQKKQIKNLTW